MKYITLIVVSFLFVKCSSQVEPTLKYIEPVKTIKQELGKRVFDCDSTLEVRDRQISALKDSLFIAKYKIENVKYYLKIVDKKPTQIKFLRGWIRRAIN